MGPLRAWLGTRSGGGVTAESVPVLAGILHHGHSPWQRCHCMDSVPQPSPHLESIVREIRLAAGKSARIVFVSGNFNVVHPGHLRLLNFASECGDHLVVGLLNDQSPGALVPAHLRLEGLQAIGNVQTALVLPCPPEEFVAALRPDVVVKGKEHEHRYNPERPVVEACGGKLIFGSGEARFSSIALLQRELRELDFSAINRPLDYPARHGFDFSSLSRYLDGFSTLNVVVIGDLIVDEYITCDPLGMSQEDPTIVVTPIKQDLFVGGAGIVAAHALGLGAQVSYFSVVGEDATAEYARRTLEARGVRAALLADESRPTILKQRYRARGKTLLRVSHLRQHDISQDLIERMIGAIAPALEKADLVIFSDFNYGCLPQTLVDAVSGMCTTRNVMMVADSQASSQLGNVARFHGMHLITPTEHEARLAMRDSTSGLVVLADALQRKCEARHVFVTLGAEGVLVHSPGQPSNGLITDQLPAFNSSPKDVSGAGDSLLTCASMALAVGASIWEAAYLGSVASACQVGRVGNMPLSRAELLQELA